MSEKNSHVNRENGNSADPFAVAVESGVTVGHIPRKRSSVC